MSNAAVALMDAGDAVRRFGPKKMNPHYENIADIMLAEPTISQGDLAKRVGMTQPWVCLIIKSDSFKAYYSSRRQEINDAIRDRVTDRLVNLADKSLKLLEDGIEKKGEAMNMPDRVMLADKVLDRLGYGVKAAPVAGNVNNVQNNVTVVGTVDRATLDAARSALRAVEQMRAGQTPIIDATSVAPAIAPPVVRLPASDATPPLPSSSLDEFIVP